MMPTGVEASGEISINTMDPTAVLICQPMLQDRFMNRFIRVFQLSVTIDKE